MKLNGTASVEPTNKRPEYIDLEIWNKITPDPNMSVMEYRNPIEENGILAISDVVDFLKKEMVRNIVVSTKGKIAHLQISGLSEEIEDCPKGDCLERVMDTLKKIFPKLSEKLNIYKEVVELDDFELSQEKIMHFRTIITGRVNILRIIKMVPDVTTEWMDAMGAHVGNKGRAAIEMGWRKKFFAAVYNGKREDVELLSEIK